MQRKKKEPRNNLRLALLFIAVFMFLLFLSVSFKTYFLIKESSFDGKHDFNIEFLDNSSKSVVMFSPSQHAISVVTAKPDAQVPVPVDGVIFDEFNNDSIMKSLFKAMISGNRENLTELDLARLAFFTKTVGKNSIKEVTLSATDLESVFKDQSIVSEGKTVEIINSTDISGLGNKLAVDLVNIGINVILVKSEENNSSKIIVNDPKSYTVKRIAKFLNYPIQTTQKKQIADVIIIIGKDGIEKINF